MVLLGLVGVQRSNTAVDWLLTPGHRLLLETVDIENAITLRTLEEYGQVKTFIREVVGKAEEEIRCCVSQDRSVGCIDRTVAVQIFVTTVAGLGCFLRGILDLVLVLENTVGNQAEERAYRLPYTQNTRVGQLKVAAGLPRRNIAFYIGSQGNDLVAVSGYVEVGSPLELSFHVYRGEAELYTLIVDLANILKRLTEAGGNRKRNVVEQVRGFLLVYVCRDHDSVGEQAEVYTNIRLCGRLPAQVRVRDTGLTIPRAQRIAIIVVIHRQLGQRRVRLVYPGCRLHRSLHVSSNRSQREH